MYPIPSNETLVETRACRQCGTEFPITDKDLEFYDKVSPTFAGIKYQIPAPTLCPDCRQQRRLSFRNDSRLYRRKCDATGKEIISMYSADKPFTVYHQDEWQSDRWDALAYGRDYNFDRPFFEQFRELWKQTPLPALYQVGCEDSMYTNYSYYNKNCYLVTGAWTNENVYYSGDCAESSNSMELYIAVKCHDCYGCINIQSCQSIKFSTNTQDSSNSWFLRNCQGCSNCFMCENLTNKSYHIRNEPYTPEEYTKVIGTLALTPLSDLMTEYEQRGRSCIHLCTTQIGSENCIGDEVYNCHNCKSCYTLFYSENSAYLWSDGYTKDAYDCYGATNCPRSLEWLSFANGDTKAFGITCVDGSNLYYSAICYSSSHLFGCIGLKNKEYCIFNKQYTREEYETLVPRIIEHMRKTGEWGDFFPSSMSPFWYNETIAQEFFPLTKDEAVSKGFVWSDYEAPFPKVEKIIPASKLPSDIVAVPDDILNWAIECEVTGKPFRIIKPELEFYRKHRLSVPRRHPDQRHVDQIALRSPRKLFDRACDNCGKSIITTYSPKRPEIVYCEECYKRQIL